MKEKNTFAKLRAEKKEVQNKLNMANKTVCFQIDEIKILTDEIAEKESCIKWLNQNLNSEKKINKSIIKTAQSHKLHKDFFYKQWIKEVENKIRITKKLALSLGVNAILIAVITILLIK
jgi:hypothetical protein